MFRFARTAIALTITLSMSSFFAAMATAQSLKKVTLVQMHPVMGVGEEIFLYAVPKQLGYFKAEGLDVAIENSQNGTIAAQVIQSNGAQFGTTAPESVMLVREQGGDLVAFYGLKRNPGNMVIVMQNSPITKLEDMKGKTIGAPSFASAGGLSLKQSLADIGIGPEQYTGISTGAGPAAFAALRTGKIDALVVWDAMLGAAENTGMKLRLISIPLQDHLAGMTLATSAAFAKANPEAVAGYCRAMTKGLLFTLTNPEAAVRIFWEEFPTTKPANLDDATAVKNGTHVMKRFLEMALLGLPPESRFGDFIPEKWETSHVSYTANGMLKGTGAATNSYTPQFVEACNAFDRAAIIAQAKSVSR